MPSSMSVRVSLWPCIVFSHAITFMPDMVASSTRCVTGEPFWIIPMPGP